jgi:uncharacterized protein (DUF1499 family)
VPHSLLCSYQAPWDVEKPHFANLVQEGRQAALVSAIRAQGGKIQEEQPQYVRAAFTSFGKQMDVFEFLFDAEDNTVTLRAVPALGSPFNAFLTRARMQDTLEKLRIALGWENVYILRNRKRLFGVVESPFDSFGDVAPSGSDLSSILSECGADCEKPTD